MNNVWDDLAPPDLPSPDLIAIDPTCHGGLLGWTLRQALDELVREVGGEHNEDHDVEGGDDADAPVVALGGQRGDRDGRQCDDEGVDTAKDDARDFSIVNDSPRRDDDDVDSHLERLQGDDGNHLPEHKRNVHRRCPNPRILPEMISPILSSLGTAVAQTQQERWQRQAVLAAQPSLLSSTSSSTVLVAGMLRGRLRYYNRRGTKWRLVADGGSEVRDRRMLDPGRRRKGGRRNLPSLWEGKASERGSASEEVLKLEHPVEILAYDDK